MVQPFLLRVPTGSGAQMSMSPSASDVSADVAGSYSWTSDVQIEGLRVPLTNIALISDVDRYQNIYSCDPAADADECLVDLHTSALQDILTAAPVPVEPGSYDRIAIQTCTGNAGVDEAYTSYLKGSVTLGGTEYVTKAVGGIATGGAAEYTPLVHSACSTDYPLPQAVVVSDTLGEIVPVTLYFDMTEIAMAADGALDTHDAWRGGCSGTMPEGAEVPPFVCITYPDVAGTSGTAQPVYERYRINGAATIGLFFDASTDAPLGGFTRPFFTEGDVSNAGFNALTALRSVVSNGDGTYTVQAFGGDNTASTWAFRTEEFRRGNHTGTFTSQDGTVTATYTAVRIN